MRLFHGTNRAQAILSEGFRDGEGSYGLSYTPGSPLVLRGVWVSDQPLDINDGVAAKEFLKITLPDRLDLAAFEVVEEGKGYREWCVPAALLNEHATVVLLGEEDLDE